jgi:RHS repeat-associated protein
MHHFKTMRRATRLSCLALLLWSVPTWATDPGERSFTALGGGQIGGAPGVGAKGNLNEVLPLILPSPRGGVPMPFAVAYNGSNVVGAAGMGWDIPIASVLWQHNLSRRKPVHAFQGEPDPVTAERIFVDLGEGPMVMAKTQQAGVYQPFGGGFYELRIVGANATGRDASGRQWNFARIPALLDDDFFALTSIVDSTGRNRVDFVYDVYDKFSAGPVQPPYSSGQITMRELVLREITHSPVESPLTVHINRAGSRPLRRTRSCPKYRIQLDYTTWQGLNYPVEYPNLLSVDFAAGRPRAHTKLLHRIRVRSNINSSCNSLLLPTERTYLITYTPDVLTGQPRLGTVDWYGLNDAASDPATALPVVGYQYGSPLVDGGLQYAAAEQLSLPPGPNGTANGFAASLGSGAIYGLVRGFQDFDGDGRADFVTLDSTGQKPLLMINTPSNLGNDYSTFLSQTILPNAPAAPYNLGAPDFSFNLPVLEGIDNTYQQVIDFNGDGRPDILIATEGRNSHGDRDPNFWELLVNTPGPSGDPADIVWLPRQIDVTALRQAIQSRHLLSLTSSTDQDSKPLPLARTIQVGAFANNISVESGILTQWKLIDVNGDGYPDMVFDSTDVTAFDDTSCDATNHCQPVRRQDHPPTTQLFVIYHTGPMMAGSGADTQSVWRGPAVPLRSDGACGVERLRWLGGGLRRFECGFMEVNGDGIADYVIQDAGGIRAIRSSGLAQRDDVKLPDNQSGDYVSQEKKRSIPLPGPVGVVKDPRTTVCGTGTDPTTGYVIDQQTTLLDITGDGIADYIYFGTCGALADGTRLQHPSLTGKDLTGPQGWWFMPGTGVGFAAPLPIRAPGDLAFAIHTSQEQCNGEISSVLATLQDIDGDGRPELIRAVGAQRVRIAKIVNAAGELGAHSAGQITAIDNRYGAVNHVTYGSAKSSWLTHGRNPSPEIVVTATERTADRGLSNGLAPVRYAYGNPETVYHPLLGHRVFAGYRRRVVLVGEPTDTFNVIRGHATLIDSLPVAQLGTGVAGDLNRLMLPGRPGDVTTVAGMLSIDPRQLLVDTVVAPPTSNQHTEWKTQALPGTVPILVPLEEECYGTPSAQAPGIFGDLVLCRRVAAAYASEQTSWEGSHPYPAADSVATRTVVDEVDSYARPLRMTFEGDRFRSDDDACVQIDYSTVANDTPVFLNAPHSVRTTECGNQSQVLAGVRYLYDGLPEGQVGAGFPSGQILERHNTQTFALLDQSPTWTIERDLFGNPKRYSRTLSDGSSSSTRFTYDPFGIKPVKTETSATGLANPLVMRVERDGATLLPLTLWNQNHAATYNTYDRYGRLTRVSLGLPADPNRYVLTDMTFTGFEGGVTPRFVLYRSYAQWTTEANADTVDPKTVSVYSENLDEMGRLMDGVVDLGADYNGQSVVMNLMTYDALGRLSFEADPFPANTFGQHYGTTYTYYPDGRSACAIQGQGLQTLITTDEAVDRYPTCMTYAYANHQAVTQTQGPNELASGKPQSGAVDEELVSGSGQVLQRDRIQAGTALEEVDYAYDRLGQQTLLTRWADPQGGSGRVQWSWINDSFGRVLTSTEPRNVAKSYAYDPWGRVSGFEWLDSTGIVAVKQGVRFDYDGLSRVINMRETRNGQDLPETLKEYHYDSSSGQPQHLDGQYLTGHLSWARAAGRSVFLGYDAFGRLTTTSRSDTGDASFYAERRNLGPQGELAGLDLVLPGTNAPEKIKYDYDSARRMSAIQYADAAGTSELWRALQTDVFGRYLETRFGNGAVDHTLYRADHRRELTERRTESGPSKRVALYGTYDGEMLLTRLTQSNNFSGSPRPTVTDYGYDARSALTRVTVHDPTSTVADLSYAYDGLGNLLGITDALNPANSVELRTDKFDRDRLCAVIKVGASNTTCTYTYDALGNVRDVIGSQTRSFSYEASGRMLSATTPDTQVHMEYDPFGAMSVLRSAAAGVERRESFYGDVRRVGFFDGSGQPVNVGAGTDVFQNFLERQIQSPQGIVAVVRRANTGPSAILYPVGENQGTRATLGANGDAAETIDYGPYGAVAADSKASTALTWWPYQWNGGHVLEGLGLVVIGGRVLDGNTGRFLERDPAVNMASATTAHPYAFAWDNPVAFIDPTGAEPTKDDGGQLASGLAAVGKLLYRAPTDPGEQTEPYVETRWACNADHDCISAVESLYPLTDFEKGLRAQYHSGPRESVLLSRDYHVVMDGLSGAVLGYAFYLNSVEIYDRSGNLVKLLAKEAPATSSWLQPADILAGPLSGFLRGSVGNEVARSGVAAVEDSIADDAVSDGIDASMARRPPPFKFGPTNGAMGFTNPRTGQITIDSALQPGTKDFTETLFHEQAHSFLVPTRGLLATFRQNRSIWFRRNSHLLKYTEEALAETYGTLNPIRGLAFPFTHGYNINPVRLVLEGGLYGGGLYGSFRLGQDLRGEWDSP